MATGPERYFRIQTGRKKGEVLQGGGKVWTMARRYEITRGQAEGDVKG